MRSYPVEAIILRRTNYGEADRILNILTPSHGKISVIARGVRRSKSKLAGSLELFACSSVTVSEGRGNMGLVISARLIKFYGNILHDYDRMMLGYEFIKIINRTVETVSEADFYYLLRDSFGYLDELNIDYRLVELWFRLRMMSLLGREINLITDIAGEKLSENKVYDFNFGEGAFVENEKGRFGSDKIKLLRLAQIKNPALLRQVGGISLVVDDCLWLVREG